MNYSKALITGAASGIGRATAFELAEKGLSLILCDHPEVDLSHLCKSLGKEKSVSVESLQFNLSNIESSRLFLEKNNHVFEDVDVLVNCAGIGRGFGKLYEADPSEWSEMIDLNLLGPMLMCKALVPHMLENEHGHIINIGSLTGRLPFAKEGAYGATKFAIRSFSESLRMDLHGSGIRVSTVQPGLTRTNFSDPLIYHGTQPLDSEDVAESVAFCLEQPEHVNLQELTILPRDQYGHKIDRENTAKEFPVEKKENSDHLVMVTGATSGIGLATAKGLAKAGFQLIICGRQSDVLSEIKNYLQKEFSVRVETLCFDLKNKEEIDNAVRNNRELLSEVDTLINNAGVGCDWASMHQTDVEDWQDIVDVNVKAPLYLINSIVPQMVEKKSGHIINIGSVAGRWTYPHHAPYIASKFALRGISDSLRLDLFRKMVRVTNIEPGFTSGTRFGQPRDCEVDEKSFPQKLKKIGSLEAEDVARSVLWSIERPLHVNVQEVVMFPTSQSSIFMT